MEQQGTRYSGQVLGSKVVIEQNEEGVFDLLLEGKLKGTFASATAAREKLISVVKEQLNIDDAAARGKVPQLTPANWAIETTAPFNPEKR